MSYAIRTQVDRHLRAVKEFDVAEIRNRIDDGRRELMPEKKLAVAMLEQAIIDHDRRAGAWVHDCSCDYCYSFIACCEYIGLNSVAVKAVLDRTPWPDKRKRQA